MEPSDFRRDPWLRTSGYHLATWSLVAFVLELRRMAGAGQGSGTVLVALLGGALLTSLTHERRVGKMAGVAGPPLHPRIGVLWGTIAGALALASLAMVAIGRAHWMYPLWLVLAGEGFLLWGLGVGFAWYRGLGVAMLAAGVLDVVLMLYGREPPARLVVLGLLLPIAGIATSYRYLWFRSPAQPSR